MSTAYSLTSKFQVTIPKQVRQELRLTERDKITFARRGRDFVIKKLPSVEDVRAENQKFMREHGIKPATDYEIKHAREEFYRKGMSWED